MGAISLVKPIDPASINTFVMPSNDMFPEIRRGSILFIGEADYAGQVLYSLPSPDGRHDGNIRRLTVGPKGACSFTTDYAKTCQEFTFADRLHFVRHDIRPVLAVLNPYDLDFAYWLQTRFERSMP